MTTTTKTMMMMMMMMIMMIMMMMMMTRKIVTRRHHLINKRPWHCASVGNLRMVHTLATAHTFSASRDGPRGSDFLRTVPTNSKVFCAVYKYAGKKILASVILQENWG